MAHHLPRLAFPCVQELGHIIYTPILDSFPQEGDKAPGQIGDDRVSAPVRFIDCVERFWAPNACSWDP